MKPKTILIIDSDFPVRSLLEAKLGAHSHHIFKAENVLDALTITENYKPDLIIMELELDQESGFSVLESLRNHQHPEIKSIPIVVLTNQWSNFYKAKAVKYGISNFIVKAENTIDEIAAKVGAALGKI